MKKYNIEDYVTTMDIEKVSTEESIAERRRYSEYRGDLKRTIYKIYFYNGYFNQKCVTKRDKEYFSDGFSPVRITEDGREETTYTVHHIQPLNCGGKTLPPNLVPIPRDFHSFIHKVIFDPQIDQLNVGDKKHLVGVPDFSKITLDMMNDVAFRIQYHKYVVDKLNIIPHTVLVKQQKDDTYFWKWYKDQFHTR